MGLVLKSVQDQELWIQPTDVSKWVFLTFTPSCEMRALLPAFTTAAVSGLGNAKQGCDR